MIVTESQLRRFQEIRPILHRTPESLVIPSKNELVTMEAMKYTMTADDYFALAKEDRKKWYVNWNPRCPAEFLRYDEEKKENVYRVGIYFEPWHPSILDRLY